MSDQEEYIINFYIGPSGVTTDTALHSKLEYLQAKMFLNMLTERTYNLEYMPRPIPDRPDDWYELTIDQYHAYAQFLDRLRGKAPQK